MHDIDAVTLSTRIYDWYELTHGYEREDISKTLRRDSTLADALEAIDYGTSLHEIVYSTGDCGLSSNLRGELIDELADLTGSTRDEMYNVWLDGAGQLDAGSGRG